MFYSLSVPLVLHLDACLSKRFVQTFFFFVGPDTYIIFQGALRQDSKRAKDFQSQ